MKFAEFPEPRAHIVIDDIFSPAQLSEIMLEVKKLEGIMRVGLQGGEANTYIDTKRNRLCILTPKSRVGGKKSAIYSAVQASLFSDKVIQNLISAKSPGFEIMSHCKMVDLQLSAYGHGDFYQSHIDINPISNLTCVFFLCCSPKKFSGGNFIIEFGRRKKTIQFKNNRLIVFASNTRHSVTPVKMKARNFMSLRFTVQVWPKVGIPGRPDPTAQPPSRMATKSEPLFGMDKASWGRMEEFFRATHPKQNWSGDFPDLLEDGRAILLLLVSNLKYLARVNFPSETASVKTSIAATHSDEFAKITCTTGKRKVSFGYILAPKGEGRLRLRFFASNARKGVNREKYSDISPGTDFRRSNRVLQKLLKA